MSKDIAELSDIFNRIHNKSTGTLHMNRESEIEGDIENLDEKINTILIVTALCATLILIVSAL